jgi:hypothetical protein
MPYPQTLGDLFGMIGQEPGNGRPNYNAQHLKPYSAPSFPQRQSDQSVLPRNWYEADDGWRAAYADAIKNDPTIGSFENFIRMQRFYAQPRT